MQDFKRMTKTKAFKNTIFFVILVSLILGASGALSYVSMQDEHLIQSRNKSMIEIQRQPENSLDVIVVGDSLSYSAISPMQMWEDEGLTSYICGQSGQKVQETYSMLETAFEHQKPKVVVMETGPLFRVRGKARRLSLRSRNRATVFSRFSGIMMYGNHFCLERNTESRILMAIWCVQTKPYINMEIPIWIHV